MQIIVIVNREELEFLGLDEEEIELIVEDTLDNDLDPFERLQNVSIDVITT